MSAESISFAASLRIWRTETNEQMAFVSIAGETAGAIGAYELLRRLELGRRGFGSVKVEAGIGDSRWSTSVFPQKEGGWFLPVKKAICRAEGLSEDDEIAVRLQLL